MNPIQPIGVSPTRLSALQQASGSSGPQASGGAESFKDLMLRTLQEANQTQNNADQAMHSLGSGEQISQGEAFSTIQKADMSFRLMQQIHQQLMQAYQEIKEIQI